MIIDAITSSPLNLIVSIVIGVGLVYIFYRKPPTSSNSSSSSSSSPNNSFQTTNSGIPSAAAIGINRHSSNFISPFSSRHVDGPDEDLQRVLAQIERQERDLIRQEQDEAYRQSLLADKEKQTKKQEELRRSEEEKKRKEEEEELERYRQLRAERVKQSLEALKKTITNELPPIPTKEEVDAGQCVKLVFKLPDGSRVQRLFRKNDKVKYLHYYIFSLPEAPLQFNMTTNFPKRDLPGRSPINTDFLTDDTTESQDEELYGFKRSDFGPNCEETLDNSGLGDSQIIFVHDSDA